MTIETIKDRLKLLQQGITGVKRAYAQLPKGVVNSADLPLFMNFVRPSKYDTEGLGSDDIQSAREYLMWLLVKPVAEGEEGEGESLVEPWIDKVTSYFFARPSLGNLQWIRNSYITEDSGPKKLVWPGIAINPTGVYWGVEFRLTVVEIMNREYVDNE